MVEYDILNAKTEVRGSIGIYPTRTIAFLYDGNVYTFDDRGCILRYRPQDKVIENLGVRIPNGGYEADIISVFALCADPSGKKLYGLSSLVDQFVSVKNVFRGGYIFEYSADGRDNGTLKDLGKGGVSEGASTSESELYHAITFGKDDKVYYCAPVKGKPVHLMSYDPETGKKHDHGEMWVEGESIYVNAVFAACTGKDGRLFWGGLLKSDGDPKWDNEAVLIICDPGNL